MTSRSVRAAYWRRSSAYRASRGCTLWRSISSTSAHGGSVPGGRPDGRLALGPVRTVNVAPDTGAAPERSPVPVRTATTVEEARALAAHRRRSSWWRSTTPTTTPSSAWPPSRPTPPPARPCWWSTTPGSTAGSSTCSTPTPGPSATTSSSCATPPTSASSARATTPSPPRPAGTSSWSTATSSWGPSGSTASPPPPPADAGADSVATATALTNHGTILSVPHRNRPQRSLPDGMTAADAARRVAAGSLRLRPSIPTAIGHCVYIRRAALDLVGGFDESFAPGYGEEVDFSQRAVAHGFRHVCADDVFVFHRGGSSFGASPRWSSARRATRRWCAAATPGTGPGSRRPSATWPRRWPTPWRPPAARCWGSPWGSTRCAWGPTAWGPSRSWSPRCGPWPASRASTTWWRSCRPGRPPT